MTQWTTYHIDNQNDLTAEDFNRHFNYDSTKQDPLKTMKVSMVGEQGMKIDRMYFDRFEETIKEDKAVQKMIEKRDLEAIEKYIIENKNFALLNTNPNGDVFRKLTPEMRNLIPQYIKENISIYQFNA